MIAGPKEMSKVEFAGDTTQKKAHSGHPVRRCATKADLCHSIKTFLHLHAALFHMHLHGMKPRKASDSRFTTTI